jgi:hypothetical protein
MQAMQAQRQVAGRRVARRGVVQVVASSNQKTDLKKAGMNSVKDVVVKNNLLGT